MNVQRPSVFGLSIVLISVFTAGALFIGAQESQSEGSGSDSPASSLAIEKRLLSLEEAMEALRQQYPTTGVATKFPAQPPTRAIVAARLLDDKPDSGGVWKGRLISMDTAVSSASNYVRHVDPGAKLVLVNLCDEPVKFTFHESLLEEGYVFTVPMDGVVTVTVKTGVEVGNGNDKSKFSVSSDTYFSSLPGPHVFIP